MPESRQEYPVPGKTYVAEFSTPDQRDRYLYEYRDVKTPGFEIPEYGTPHEDQEKWEGYKVSLVVPDKERGFGWWIIVYTRDRRDQEAHNAGLVEYPYGSNTFPRITRTYIYPASEYAASGPQALGTADPELDAAGDPVYSGAVQVEPDRVEDPGDPALDQLYVKVTRVFENIPNLDDNGELTAAAAVGYKVEYPYSSTSYPRVTWTTPAASETPASYGSACPISGYTDAVLIEQQYVKEKGVIIGVQRIYEKLPGEWRTTTTIDEDGMVITTKQRLNALGAFTDGETLSGGVWTKKTRKEMNAYYGMEIQESRSIPGNTLTYKIYDELTDTVVSETRRLIDATDAEYVPTTYLSGYRDVPIGTLVKMRIIRTYPAGVTAKSIVEYKRERYVYPAILDDLDSELDAGITKSGRNLFWINPNIESERARTVPARLTSTFVTTLSVLPTVLNIQPRRIQFDGVLFNLQTGPVLCNTQTIQAVVGSGDPLWDENTTESMAIQASTPSATTYVTARSNGNWFVADFDVKKLASGLWMITTVEIPYL